MGSLMSRRPDADGTSQETVRFRATTEEAEAMRALAKYLTETVSQMFRRLHEEERQRLVDAGHRPPRKLRNNE